MSLRLFGWQVLRNGRHCKRHQVFGDSCRERGRLARMQARRLRSQACHPHRRPIADIASLDAVRTPLTQRPRFQAGLKHTFATARPCADPHVQRTPEKRRCPRTSCRVDWPPASLFPCRRTGRAPRRPAAMWPRWGFGRGRRERGRSGRGASACLRENVPNVGGFAAVWVVFEEVEAFVAQLLGASGNPLGVRVRRALLTADDHAEVRQFAAADGSQHLVKPLVGAVSLVFAQLRRKFDLTPIANAAHAGRRHHRAVDDLGGLRRAADGVGVVVVAACALHEVEDILMHIGVGGPSCCPGRPSPCSR